MRNIAIVFVCLGIPLFSWETGLDVNFISMVHIVLSVTRERGLNYSRRGSRRRLRFLFHWPLSSWSPCLTLRPWFDSLGSPIPETIWTFTTLTLVALPYDPNIFERRSLREASSYRRVRTEFAGVQRNFAAGRRKMHPRKLSRSRRTISRKN